MKKYFIYLTVFIFFPIHSPGSDGFSILESKGCASGEYDDFDLVQTEVKVYSRFDYTYTDEILCMPVLVDNFIDLDNNTEFSRNGIEIPPGGTVDLSVEEVHILDRYGNNLFSKASPFFNGELWNGRSCGEMVPPGDYVLDIKIKKADEWLVQVFRDITLIP